MKLSAGQRRSIARQHDAALARVVAAEAIMTELGRRVVMRSSTELLNRATADPDLVRLRIAVSDLAPALAGNVRAAMIAGRGRARALALGQVSTELEAIREALVAQELDASSIPMATAGAETGVDVSASTQAGLSVSSRWAAASLAALMLTKRQGRQGPEALLVNLARVPSLVDGTLRRITVTSATDAYADEHRGAWKRIVPNAGPYRTPAPTPTEDRDTRIPARAKPLRPSPSDVDSGEPGLPLGWAAGLFDVWSAVLDRKTCPLCMEKDGSMVPKGSQWPGFGRPPAHPFCRCVPVTIFVPEAAAKRLPGIQIDYGALKEDVREFFTSRKFTGRRHAESYIREVIAQKNGAFVTTSPEALTRRFRNRKASYLGSSPTPPRAPALPPLFP